MLFSSWLRNCKSSLARRSAGNQTRRRRSSAPRPRLEALEDRLVPASLSYSTLLNGTVLASAVDSSGNVYAASEGGVTKLNSTGTAVLYQQLGSCTCSGIALNPAGDAYVIGVGSNVPTTPNAIASAPSGSNPTYEDFVAELDPTGNILYATYLPGTVNDPYIRGDYPGAIAVDGSGNIYVAGAAQAGLPVTANAFQTNYLGGSNGGTNAFFMKIDPALSGMASVLYASYLGGSGDSYGNGDEAEAITLDGSGNAYLYGTTNSSNFPTTSSAFQRTFGGGGQDAFVAKFNPALSGAASLVFSTYLGGSLGDGYLNDQPAALGTDNPAGGITVDSAGNVYVTGSTLSSNFPTTQGAYQVTSNIMYSKQNGHRPSDVFVTKLNPTGSALVYSTYIGGGGSAKSGGTYSGGSDIAVDSSGDAYVTGWTNSTTFPTKNPIQSTNKAGTGVFGYQGTSAFVTELNSSGSGLLFSTYLGGSSLDFGFSIALDSANNVYVAGKTEGVNFPTTAGAYDTTSGNGFVAKISGVSPATATPAIASPSSGVVAASGQTTSSGSPQIQKSNGQPAPSQADQLFTLIGNTPGVSVLPGGLSGLPSEWQSLESALLTRFDSLLSLEAGAMGLSKDTLIRDLLFTSEFLPASR